MLQNHFANSVTVHVANSADKLILLSAMNGVNGARSCTIVHILYSVGTLVVSDYRRQSKGALIVLTVAVRVRLCSRRRGICHLQNAKIAV